ncbi:M23 family metallopeptidase [bacterium SCSIO 12643]|nr:M23 family metallopeptidase [bacterium SCSIO 12643]
MEEKPEKRRKKVIRKLRYKFRLVIINDDTYEEHFSLKLSLLNIITAVGLLMIFVAVFVGGVLAFTPLREYIPGYSDLETKKNAAYAAHKSDSLAKEIAIRDVYLKNIKNILSGEIAADSIIEAPFEDVRIENIQDVKSQEDSLMRKSIEEQEQYALHNSDGEIEDKVYLFFNPVKGTVIEHFNVKKGHFGVDVVTKEGEPIKSVMDGTIVMADYTTKSGFVVQIQHHNDLLSVYKHCSAVLKQTGEVVNAGDPIAVVGNTGELTTGPHLHFELWENGIPIDPENHIIF